MSRRKRALQAVENNNTVDLQSYKRKQKKKAVELIPKSINQETYITGLTDPEKLVVFASGPAGTGKTMLAMLAAIKAFKEGKIDKIVLTRPAVGVDNEKHGFLPGDINAKMEPWTRPLFDVLHEYYSPKETQKMLEDQTIEISPLAFMRGRNLHNSYIIADEVQNTTTNQMKMLLTRVGENSKIVLTGDLQQTDIHRNNGLNNFIDILKNNSSDLITMVEFADKDIQRSKAVKEVLRLYSI